MAFNKENFVEHVADEPIGLFKPMKMVYTFGCVANELSVNGINETDMTESQRKIIIHRLMMWYKKNPDKLNNLLQYFIESNAEECDMTNEPCECCGDIIVTYKMSLE